MGGLIGWVARGLAMAGRAEDAERLLGLLTVLARDKNAKIELLDESSRAFGYVLGVKTSFSCSSASGTIAAQLPDIEAWGRRALSKQFNCSSRILWEQRTLVAQLAALKDALKVLLSCWKSRC